jgi:hypothetical protein
MKARIKPRSKLPHLGRILLEKLKLFSTDWQQHSPCFQPLGRILRNICYYVALQHKIIFRMEERLCEFDTVMALDMCRSNF